ncbi:TetR/AcrR family transcriptional regulator [Streptococcus sanguinis]|uniref:TetR/AcrR family transcriptional regulator n=1 Tax=Streptococcus sanguinis TaxID=1305 RepID=A0A3P1S419_STRSA|nr:MAG: TetR/AcrR family transcriptional regulator [Streptococcus sp.]RRC91981.1 TetR/AcrR family transcriptional regulator [Streptococcus sanguinis]
MSKGGGKLAEKKPPLKELLLQAGFDSIAAHGWQDLSLRKLASSCKVSHVASYRHFKNKDDLMFALVPIISKHFADFLKESEKEDQAPREKILQLALQFINYSQVHANFFDFLFLSKYSLATQNDDTGQIELEKRVASFDYNKEKIEEFIQSLDGDYDFNQVFMHLGSFVFGISLLVRQKIYPADKKELTSLIQTTLAFYQ